MIADSHIGVKAMGTICVAVFCKNKPEGRFPTVRIVSRSHDYLSFNPHPGGKFFSSEISAFSGNKLIEHR